MADDEANNRVHVVLLNEEGQYSLWSRGKTIPSGWRSAGKEGSKAQCLSYVDDHWTDMRPVSLRKRMEDAFR
jgi:MbtH protein